VQPLGLQFSFQKEEAWDGSQASSLFLSISILPVGMELLRQGSEEDF
jgi:hypothetical protein